MCLSDLDEKKTIYLSKRHLMHARQYNVPINNRKMQFIDLNIKICELRSRDIGDKLHLIIIDRVYDIKCFNTCNLIFNILEER